MKNVRVRVVESCGGVIWWPAICKGKRRIFEQNRVYDYKYNAQRAAKSIAKQIGIKYDPEILKLHDC